MLAAILTTRAVEDPNCKFQLDKRLYDELLKLGIQPVFIYGDPIVTSNGLIYNNGYTASDFDFYIDLSRASVSNNEQYFEFDDLSTSPNPLESMVLATRKDWMCLALDSYDIPMPQTFVTGLDLWRNRLTENGFCSPHNTARKEVIFGDVEIFINEVLSKPNNNSIIMKPISGDCGYGILEFVDIDHFENYFRTTPNETKLKPDDVILQQKIEHHGIDYRAYVVGNRVLAAIRRTAQEGEWRTNFSLGSTITPFELTAEQEHDAIRAMQAVNLGFGTVDIIIDERTGQHYICEVNGTNSGMKSIEIAHPHINVAAEVARYIVQEFCPTACLKPKPEFIQPASP